MSCNRHSSVCKVVCHGLTHDLPNILTQVNVTHANQESVKIKIYVSTTVFIMIRLTPRMGHNVSGSSSGNCAHKYFIATVYVYCFFNL